MSDVTTIKTDKQTYITDGSGTVVDGKFFVTGNWAKNPNDKDKYTYHITTTNGRKWDSPCLDFDGNTATFNPPD